MGAGLAEEDRALVMAEEERAWAYGREELATLPTRQSFALALRFFRWT